MYQRWPLPCSPPSTSAADIVSAMETFMAGFSGTLNNMVEATLATHKKALIGKLTEKDARLTQRSNRYWYEIDRSNFNFDTRDQLVAAIESIDLKTLQDSYQQDFIDQPRQLVTMAIGKENKEAAVPEDHTRINQAELSELTTGYFEE